MALIDRRENPALPTDTLAKRRNALAHGDPLEGLATAGQLELIRALINFSYLHSIAEAESIGSGAGSNTVPVTRPVMADAQ